MSSLIAVAGCSLEASVSGGSITASLSITTSASTDVLAEGSGAYFKSIEISVLAAKVTLTTPPAGTTGVGTAVAGQTVTINGSGSNVLLVDTSGNQKAVLEGDSATATLNFAFVASSGSSPVSGTVDVTIKISSAGQSSVYVS